MISVTGENLQENTDSILSKVINDDVLVKVVTPHGNAVILSVKQYNELVEKLGQN